MTPQDYTRRSWQAAAALIAVLAAVAFIPPQTICGIPLRRANILSDLLRFDDKGTPSEALPKLEDEFQAISTVSQGSSTPVNSCRRRIQPQRTNRLPQRVIRCPPCRSSPSNGHRPETIVCRKPLRAIPRGCLRRSPRSKISTRSPTGVAPFLYTAGRHRAPHARAHRRAGRLVHRGRHPHGRPARAAATALRRPRLRLHTDGFAPDGYRRTVGTRSTGWNSYNIMQRRNTPEALRGDYSVSGWLCRPADGATVRWTGSDFRRRLDGCGTARLLFISRNESRLELTLNDSLHRTFDIPASEALARSSVRAPIASLALRVERGQRGIHRLRRSIRGRGRRDGRQLLRSEATAGSALGTMRRSTHRSTPSRRYDLVVLQYGLNIMQEGVTNYSAYAARVEKMIAFVRSCFPDAAVLVLSTSDRLGKVGDADSLR